VKKNKIDFFFQIFFSDVNIFPELQQISMTNLCHLLQQKHDTSHMIAHESQQEDPEIIHPN